MSDDAIVPRVTVDAMVGNRDLAVQKFAEGFAQLQEADERFAEARSALSEACLGRYTRESVSAATANEVKAFLAATNLPDMQQMERVARRLVDLSVWQALFEHTDMETLMDRQSKREFRAMLEYVPEETGRDGELINREEIERSIPPVTVDTVTATLEQKRAEMPETWARGVANAFSELDPRFKSHDGFKVGSRIILTRCFSQWGGWNSYTDERAALIDIERVFLVLDGKPPEGAKGIAHLVDEARRGNGLNPSQGCVEGDYFRFRWFKNGNAHLWFTRNDLVHKVNQTLADYYGGALGYGRDSAEHAPDDPEERFSQAMERAHPKGYAFFPTPEALAKTVQSEAQLFSNTPLQILEPSAGTGSLSRHLLGVDLDDVSWNLRDKYAEIRHHVDCVEIQPELCGALRGSGKYRRVINRNFLKMPVEPIYDRVVMNPPFDRGRDMEHIVHALRFLAPGGRLVAITSASARYGTSNKHKAFHRMLRRYGKPRWRDNPAGSFAESGTNVNTCLLTLDI